VCSWRVSARTGRGRHGLSRLITPRAHANRFVIVHSGGLAILTSSSNGYVRIQGKRLLQRSGQPTLRQNHPVPFSLAVMALVYAAHDGLALVTSALAKYAANSSPP